MMTQSVDEVIEHKVKHATAVNAMRKISTIVGEEQKIEAAKVCYTRWLLRYGIAMLLLVCAILAHFLGVI
jgi:hypothetical protein